MLKITLTKARILTNILKSIHSVSHGSAIRLVDLTFMHCCADGVHDVPTLCVS